MASHKHNSAIQSLGSATTSTDFGVNQAIANNPVRSSSRGDTYRGRSGRRHAGRGRDRDLSARTNVNCDHEQTPLEGNESAQSLDVPPKPSGSSSSRGHKPSSARSSAGKYRQRQQTDQLISGIDSLHALDIDLVESIVPTSEIPAKSGRGRHATNTRKVNLAQLLNNKYERRMSPRYASSYDSSSHYRSNNHHNRDYVKSHKFNKQQFLQANCQFVVSSGPDYTIHKIDPDWPVDWDCIEEVRFKQCASTESICPICLEPPTAAKITRCGHIYCWTCMLHYLSLSDENCRQCPICFEAIYKEDLRSVVSHSFINHSIQEDIVMRLMFRKKGCVEVEPYGDTEMSPSHIALPSIELDHYSSRANLVIVNPITVVTKIAQRERDELLKKRSSDKDLPEVCFIDQAMRLLADRVDKLHENNNTNFSKTISSQRKHQEVRSPQTSMVETSNSYLFYQSEDGQHIYLNPFSTKILCHEYGSLENCPIRIKSKILQMDWISMNEGWRNRFRYLGHLPLTCEFRLIEIDLQNSGLISDETYSIFANEANKRKQERDRQSREERKREKLIRVQQDRKIYGIQPSLNINLDNMDQFPSVSDERYVTMSKIPRNLSRGEYNVSSSDDEHQHDQIPEVTDNPMTGSDQPVENQTEEVDDQALTRFTLSFREIQLQEAAIEAKSAEIAKSKAMTNPTMSRWPSTSSGNQAQSSSFAQLLSDAKSSQKIWTRNPNAGRQTNQNLKTNAEFLGIGTSKSMHPTNTDDSEEELRAPPVAQLTISDLVELNEISSKKRNKTKSSSKKKL